MKIDWSRTRFVRGGLPVIGGPGVLRLSLSDRKGPKLTSPDFWPLPILGPEPLFGATRLPGVEGQK